MTTDNLAELRKRTNEKMVQVLQAALAELERRGYEVRGKTLAEIEETVKRPPTKPR